MARDTISVQYPQMDITQSIAGVKVTPQTVTAANGVCLEKAFDNKNNSLVICIENTLTSDSEVIFKAGDNYPNAKLGDLSVPVLASSTNFYQVQDPSRFENKNGCLDIDFDDAFTGSIFAVAKSVAVE